MKPLYQFFTLLKKHILLRRRQPSLLLLEILWPIFVFTIVAIIRSGIPPFKVGKCHYPTRAMPSAGMVPFIQNFACNLNNQCETKDIFKEAHIAEDRLEKMAQKLAPIFTAKQSMSSLKTVDKIIDALQNMEGEDIEDILKKGVSIRDLFKDPDAIQEIFVDKLNIFPKDAAEAFLNSKVNLKEILSLTGYIGLKEIACNATLLNSYIIFPQNTNISAVSAAICAINSSMIPNITETVQQHLNMINILKKVSLLMKPYGWSEGLFDLVTMMDTFFNTPTAKSFLKDFKGLGNLTEVIKRLPEWLLHLQKFHEFDFERNEELLNMMEPFLLSTASNETLKSWQLFKSGLNLIERLFGIMSPDMQHSLESIKISLKHLFDNSSHLVGFLSNELNLPRDVVEEIIDKEINVPKFLDFLNLFNETDIEVFLCKKPGLNNILLNSALLINSSSDGFRQQTVQDILCANFTKAHLEFLNKYIDTSSGKVNQKIVHHAISEFQDDIKNIIATFKHLPPEVGKFINAAAYAEIGQIATLLMTFNETSIDDNVDLISEYIVEQTRKYFDNDDEILHSAKNILHFIDNILKYLKGLPSLLEKADMFGKAFETLDSIDPELSKKLLVTLKDPANMNMVKDISSVINKVFHNIQKRDVKDVNNGIEKELAMNLKSIFNSIEEMQKYNLHTWLYLFSKIQDPKILKLIEESGVLSSLAATMESDPLWKYLGPPMKIIHMSIKKVNEIVSEFEGLNIQFDELLMFQFNYGIELSESMLFLLGNPKVNFILQNASNPEEMMCSEYGLLTSWAMSPDIPVESLEAIFCKSNFTRLLLKLSSFAEVYMMFDNIMQSSTPVKLDWNDFVADLKGFFKVASDFIEASNKMMMSGPHSYVEKLMTMLYEEIGKLHSGNHQAEMIIDAATKVALYAQNSPLVSSRVKEQLKLNLIIFDIYLDVVLESAMQKGDPNGISNMFAVAISQLTPFYEGMLKILSYSINYYPHKVLANLLEINGRRICEDLKISNILLFPPDFNQSTITSYENAFCNLNWTVVAEKLSVYPKLEKLSMAISSLYGKTTPQLNLDVTELSMKAKEYIKLPPQAGGIQNIKDFVQIYHKIFFELTGNLTHMNISNIGKDDSVADLVSMMWKLLYNNTNILPGENTKNMQILFAVIDFIDLNINNMQGKREIYLMDYVNSPEFSKMLKTAKFSKKFIDALFEWLQIFIREPQKMVKFWFDNIEHICDKKLSNTLPPYEMSIHTILCEELFSQTNITKLIQELQMNLPGFNKLINTLNDITYNNGATTKTDITSLDRLSTSLMVLMQMPPKFHLSSSSSPKEFRNMWSMFMKRVNDELGVNKIDMDKILKRIVPLMEMQMKPLIEKNPQVYYMMMNSADVLLKKLDATLPDVKQGETKLDFEEMFGKNTEMQRMYKNMEELPSVVTSVMFNILTNTESKPIMEVLGSSSVQEMGSKICTSANYQRFATPSCISFDLNKFLRVMCRIDYDTLESEMKNFIPMDRAMQTDIQPLSISPKPPSIYSMLTTVENLWEKMMAMSMVPNSMNMWKPLNLWMNQKPQMDAMMKEFLDMSSDIIDPGSFQYIGYFENMITEIFFRTEEHEHIVMFEEQVLKIVNLNLEKILTGDIKFDMLISENSELYKLIVMMGKSKTFINILTEGIESALGNYHRLVAMLNLANWKNMCNDKSIVLMLFPQANYQEFSEDICGMIYKNINMTALEIQVNEGIPGLKDFLTFLSDMPGANVKINYTAVAVENLKFQRLMSHFIMNFSSIFPKIKQNWSDSMFGNILYGSLLEQWGSIDNVINIVSSTALHQIVNISLSGYGKTPGIIQEFNHQLFVQYHIVEFLNHHLTKINASSSFDLLDYINSTELMKVVKNAEKIPDSVELLPTFFLHMIKNQDNIEKLFDENTWKTICSDKNMFYEIFAPATVSIDDIDEVRKAVCDTLMNGIDTKKLQMQLMGNIAGLKELIDTITSASRNNSDLMPTEFQSFTYEIEHLQELLESLTSKRLDVLIGGDNQWFTEEKYKDIFQKFEKEWNFANTNILKARSMMLENYLTVILNSNISDANLLIIKTNLYQQLAIMKFINTRLEQLTKNGKFDPQMYIDEPLLKALELFEKNSLNIESLFDILLELVRNPLKVKELMKVNDWEDFCKNPGSLSQMFNSSSPKTNITRILKLLCDNELVKLNVPKQILSLISSLDGFEDLLDDFNRSMVVKDPSKLAINVSAVVKEIEHFENLLMLLSLPKELNTTLPDKMEIVYYKMINVLTKKLKEMQNILSADGPFPGYDSIDDILDLGYSSLPFSIKQSLFLQSTSLNRTQIVFKFLVSQIQAIDDSPDILHYIEASAKLLKWFQLIERLPEVTDVVLSLLLDVLKDPHKLKMLQNIETVDSICQNTTGFQILVPSSILNGKTNITALQVIFCDLLMDVRNETQLTYLIEMLEGLPQLIKQLQDVGNMKPDTFLPGKFYIEVAQTSMQLQKVLTSLLHQGISSKLDISLLDKFKTEYLHTLQLFALQWDAISSNYDIDSILDILIEIDETMNHIPKNLLSSVTNFSNELNTNILMQYYTAKFVNIHLKKIKGTDTLVLMDYLKSNEMTKLFGFVEMAPDFLKIFLHSMYRLIQRPDEVRHILPHVTWDSLCANISIFEHIFDTKYLQMNTTHIHSIVCNKVLSETNFTLLVQDLSQNVEGFSIYIHNMHVLLTTNPENIHRTVSYFQIAKEMFLFQNLMDSLMKNPPRFFMSSNNNWLDSKAYGDTFEILQKKLKVLEQDLMNSSTKLEINIMKIIEMVGDMTGIELMPNANIIVEQKIIEFINVNLEVIAASGSFNIFEHINSMEFRKLLGQVEITPEISALVAATGFDIFMNPEMYLPFILDWTHWEKMCNNTTLFQKLFPRFEDKSSIQTACDLILPVNYEILLQELTATLPGFSSLWEMFILLENGTMSEKLSVNYTAYEMSSKKMQSLIESLVMNPPKLIWNVNTNLTLDSFNKYFINITGEDLLQQLANPQIINAYVMQFFSVLSKSTGLPVQINMQAYIEQKVLEFLIANLNPIVASDTFNMLEYIKSSGLSNLLQIKPDMVPQLISATLELLSNPERLLPLMQNETLWEKMCYDTTLFQTFFPSFKDKVSIENLCRLITYGDLQKFLLQINSTLPGFSNIIELMIFLQNHEMNSTIPVDYQGLLASEIQFQTLLTQLIDHPPKFIWGVSMDDFDDAFIGFDGNFVIQYFTTAGLNYLRLMQQIDISKLPTHLRDMVLRERVKDYVMFNLLDFITQNIQALEANQYNLMKYFNSSSELSAFLTLVDKSDTAIELISSTLKSIIISPLKVLPLLDENNWKKICINKTVFRVMFDISHKIPDADLSSLQTTVCSEVFQNVSMKTLMAEIDKTIPGWSNLIAKMSIQLDDPNLKVDVDSVEKTIYFYMQGTSNINNVFDKLKTGFNESGLPNLPSILERIAKEWKELEKDADKLSLQSIFELMKLLNGFNVLTPNTTLGKQLGMINRNLVSAQYLLQFMNIHLKNISESKNFNETSLAQSHQVLKLIGQSGISPDTFAIILNTSLQIFKDPERIFHLIEEDSWINICNFTNTDVFRKMFAIDWSQSISEQQMRFCQDLILQVDMQALQIELFSLEGFKEFYDSITGKSEDSMLDLSLLMSEAMKMQMVLTELSSKPLTWLFGNNENLLNSPKVVSLLNMWKQQLQLVNNGSVTEIYLVLPYLSPFIKQVNTMPEWKNLMSELVLYLQTLDKMLYQLSHFGQNISALLIDKPELQKSLQILLKSPEMLSSVVYNMALNEPQITKALMSIAGSQDPAASICQAMSTVKMASIPNSDFDLNSYILSICSIDFTNLKLEFLQLSSVLNKRDASSTEILDPINLLNLVKSVWEKLSVLTKSNETNFWEPLNNLLQNLILQSSLYDENTPELENIYKIISQIYHSIPTFTNHSQSPVQSIFTMLLTMNATSINEMYTKYFGDVWKEQSLEKSVLKVLESFFEDYFDGAMNPLIRELLKQKNVSFSDADIKDVIGLLWGQPYTNESISLPPPAFKIWQTVLSTLSNLTRDGKFVISNGNKSILQQHLMDMLATVQNQFQYTDMRKFTMLLSKAYNISDKTVALLLNNTDVLSKILMMDSNLKEHCYNGTFNKFLTKEASKYNNIPKEILSIINSTFCSNFDFYSALVKLYDSQYLEEKINSFFSNQSGEDFMRKIILDQVKILQEIIPNLSGLGSNTFVNEIMSSFNASSNSFGYTLMKMLSDILPITTDTIGVDTSNTTEMWKVTLDQLLVQSSSAQLIFRSFIQTGDLDMDSVVAELFKQLAMLFNIPSEMQLQPEIAYVQHVVRNLNNGNAMSSILNETHISHICHQITSMPSDSQISKNIGTYIFMIEMALEIFNYQNKNFSEIENIICDSSDKVVVNVIDLLQKSGFLNLFYKVRSMMFKNGNETIDCNHLSKLASSFPEQFYKQIHSLDSPNKAVKCLRRRIPKFMQFINHMDLMLTITAEMLDLVQDPLFESIVNNKQLSKFIAVILNSILEQRTVIVKLSQLFLDPKQAEMYLLNKTTLSPDIIKTLFDSRINMKLVELIRKSPQDMQDLICTHRNLSFYIDWPNSKVSLENVTEILCKTNLTATITGLVDYLDSVTIIQELSLLNQSFHIELPWLMNVSREMADLLENVHRLLALEDFLSSFDFNQLSRLIPNIQQLVIDQVPQKIVSSILHILDDFKRIQNTSFSQEFIEDIEITMKGILGLEAVDRIMALNAVFRNFLKSPDVVRDYLMNNLNLPHEISDALINSTVSLAQFINFRSNSVKELMCKNISRIITLSNNTNVTYQEISNHLCHLNTKTIYNLTQLIMEQLNIGEFVKQYVLLRASTLLKSTNITVPIAKETFSQMSRTSALVRGVRTAFNDNEIYKVFSNFDSSEGDLSKLKELVPLMCGRNASLMLDAEGGLSIFSSANEIKGKDGLSKSQRREYNSLPNEFCKQLYKGILKSSMGEITWKFLKPLIRGQILYTPKNKVTNTIIGKMEKFFAFIGQLQEMSQEWATGLEDVSAIRAKLQNLTDIMKYTETEFFKDMFHDMFDVDKSTLIDSIHMLNSMDDKTLGNLRLLLTNVVNYSSCLSKERFKSVSFDELQKEALNLSKSNEFLAAIIFLDTEEMEDEENRRSKRETKPKIPKHIKYEIRMNIDYVPMTRNLREQYWRPRPEDNLATEMKYLQGFIQLQDMIDKAIIESHMEEFGANVSIPGVHLKQFPYPCHMKDEYLHIVSSYLLPIMMTLAWLASLGLGIRNIVQDRAEGQEEALRVMGMYGIISWLAWMISTMIIMALVCIVVIFILHFSTIFIFSNILLMFLYFLTFCFSTVMMCYMVSSFFSNTTLAVLTGLIFYLLSYIPYIVLQSLKLELSFYQVLLVCLSSTTAFSFGSQYLSRYEEQMVGLQWKNIHESPMEGDELSFSFACTMMAIDSLIYFIIGWYVKSIMKKKYGIPKPWYFPFYPKYWGLEGANSLKHYSSSTIAPDTFYSSDVLYENRPAKGPVGISLMNLSKRYGTETAVQNLSLKFHKGEITTILGQNGAGKTTTFNMLTGLMESTTGIVAFYDSEKGKNNSWLGICPQQNILFEYMTTEEHIRFYISIKTGWQGKKLEREVRSILKDVDLLHMRNTPAKQLSGGMQRRLCVALAFAGKSSIVVLDEPTAGVDPSARRSIWDLILKYKNDRTVIMSTHHLDEADILSDRVAILHKGKLLCCGSTLFLKRHLGKGYCLSLVKNTPPLSGSANSLTASDSFDAQKTLDFISKYIPGPEISENFSEEATILLPADEKIRGNFSAFFEDFDDNLNKLGIKNYGISDTTLEEVFLQARELSNAGLPMTPENMKSTLLDDTKMSARSESHQSLESQDINEFNSALDISSKVSYESNNFTAFLTLIQKRASHYRRNWKMAISVILLPCIFFAMAVGFSKIAPKNDYKRLRLSPALYGPNSYMFYKDKVGDLYGKDLLKWISHSPGVGTTCMSDTASNLEEPFECKPAETVFKRPKYQKDLMNKTEKCECENFRFKCSKYASGIPPTQLQLNSTDFLQNLNSKSMPVSEYLLESYMKFRKKRYGGWTYERNSNNKDKKQVTVWFNNKGHHSMPAFLNGYSNAILRTEVARNKFGNPEEYGISAFNNPIQLSVSTLNEESILFHASETAISLIILLAISFIPAAFSIYLVKENISSEKYLFIISGVKTPIYWMSAFIWDLIVYCLSLIIIVIILAIFKLDSFWIRDNFSATILLIFLFGWASIPLMYTTVSFFKDPTTSYMIVFCFNIFSGLCTSVCVFLLSLFQGTQALQNAYQICRYVFLIFPQFSLSYGLVSLGNNQLQTSIFAHFGMDVYKNPFEMLHWHIISLFICGIVFFLITLFLETRNYCTRRDKTTHSSIMKEDEDVQHERMRVEKNIEKQENSISILRLTKMYRQGLERILAVNQISLGIKEGECFGLLGVNGAGKTTTFKILTGQLSASSGDVFIKDESLSKNKRNARKLMGYCPQEDALDYFLTGRELLWYHARIRGIPKSEINAILCQLINTLNLENCANKLIGTYSGGMKRKLSFAIALLGEPPIVLLDEPTAGMDPAAKRLVWNCILKATSKGQSVVLTSHSMQECDVLCNRLCIMVNGQFKCIGSPQHLKNKFSKGYSLSINLKEILSDSSNLDKYVFENFPGSEKKDSHNTTLQYSIPKNTSKVANIFEVLEKGKNLFAIQDYAVSQTTLDMVFLGFTKEQTDGFVDEIDEEDYPAYAYDHKAFSLEPEMLYSDPKLKYTQTSNL
ncbi:uncharacterized protein LOC115214454 [Octopus sinensis]|uniref:Uncharacterized protein LOC115214454 n=1 Tax=Octopus sinensis TaxID=2607531 RepID=A0A6P7SM77_9MOLL|nr:uncharacterized protein LOC115214454 [Octopus sinensis]XP_029639527.1 uncharacterized protein LOC115214454 [Octopus sinensis]